MRGGSVLSAGVHGVYSHLADDPGLKTHFSLKNAADAAGFYNDLGLASYSARYPTVRRSRACCLFFFFVYVRVVICGSDCF